MRKRKGGLGGGGFTQDKNKHVFGSCMIRNPAPGIGSIINSA